MKQLLVILLPFTFHAQSLETLQHEVELLKRENETLRYIMKGYVNQIDSLYTNSFVQETEIDLLSSELLKSISKESPVLSTDRKRLSEISTANIFVSEEVMVRMKLYVNSEGRVVVAEVISNQDSLDSEIVDLIVAAAKRDIWYESAENTGIQTAFYTLKIIPN